jgi:hypothetical protein
MFSGVAHKPNWTEPVQLLPQVFAKELDEAKLQRTKDFISPAPLHMGLFFFQYHFV